MSIRLAVVVAAVAVPSTAFGQQAVQWRVQDGGNGHWYQRISQQMSWALAREWCASWGGHLATITSQQEQSFVAGVNDGNTCWLGGYQAASSPEPDGGWSWITGEAWNYTYWNGFTAEPNNMGGSENALQFWHNSDGWNDFREEWAGQFIIEWSADCNKDGIVDYGQVLGGTLEDTNTNGVPDCCDEGISCETTPAAVQWRVEDGGNGHWYSVRGTQVDWHAAQSVAVEAGGYLATTTSSQELALVSGLVAKFSASGVYCWLGGYQPSKACEPLCDWRWVSGENWSFTAWANGEPNDFGGSEDYLTLLPDGKWYDIGASHPSIFVVEWSADCNRDGFVDFGQIREGTLQDADGNGIPDECECRTDINNDDKTDGADISVLLGFWGLTGKSVLGDIDGNGQVDAADLSALLAGWGKCP